MPTCEVHDAWQIDRCACTWQGGVYVYVCLMCITRWTSDDADDDGDADDDAVNSDDGGGGGDGADDGEDDGDDHGDGDDDDGGTCRFG